MNYLNEDSKDAFLDMEVLERPDLRYASMKDKKWVLCPKCKGHGGWNLKLNAYPDQKVPKMKHFRSSCSQCWSWGWVEEESLDATCVHDWEHTTHKMFDHSMTCTKCGRERRYDSSG